MHEAGHAAHFSNILQPSPLFSQERAPTSVAYLRRADYFSDESRRRRGPQRVRGENVADANVLSGMRRTSLCSSTRSSATPRGARAARNPDDPPPRRRRDLRTPQARALRQKPDRHAAAVGAPRKRHQGAAPVLLPRGHSVEEPRRRCGCRVDIPWGRVAAAARLPRGYSVETGARLRYEVFQLRGMLAVPYYEKALYELAEADVTPAKVAALADKIEHELQGGLASRPLMSRPGRYSNVMVPSRCIFFGCHVVVPSRCIFFGCHVERACSPEHRVEIGRDPPDQVVGNRRSVPHILSDEASCYYHGYVLAEMSVHQTREHFGGAAKIVDNAAVGAALADVYWAPGNSENFLDLVEKLTGKPLTGDPWIASLKTDVDALVADEKRDYDAFVKPVADGPVNLDMVMKIVDGDELIADSEAEGGFLAACTAFERYLATRFGV